MKTFCISLVALLALAACEGGPTPNVSDFEGCVLAGYPIMESYPRRCAVPGGPTFTETLPPSVEEVATFTGSLVDAVEIDEDGDTSFRFEGPDGVRRAVLEPEAEFATDLRGVAAGSGLVLRGWSDDDGVVHVVELEIAD
jgi:hypothetical protein